METVFGFMGLLLGAWGVRCICIIPPVSAGKIIAAIIAAAWFLAAGGIGGTEPVLRPYAGGAMLVGAGAVLWFRHRLRRAAA